MGYCGTIQIPVELNCVYFVTCPKQGLEMEAVVPHRVAFLEYFCPKQGQDFKPLAAPLYSTWPFSSFGFRVGFPWSRKRLTRVLSLEYVIEMWF